MQTQMESWNKEGVYNFTKSLLVHCDRRESANTEGERMKAERQEEREGRESSCCYPPDLLQQAQLLDPDVAQVDTWRTWMQIVAESQHFKLGDSTHYQSCSNWFLATRGQTVITHQTDSCELLALAPSVFACICLLTGVILYWTLFPSNSPNYCSSPVSLQGVPKSTSFFLYQMTLVWKMS